MRNMYDIANELQQAVTGSQEFISLKQHYEAVTADPQARALLEQFRQFQMVMQQKMTQGQQPSPEDEMQSQQLYMQMQQNPKVSGLMEAEQRMNLVIMDLNKTIMKPIEDLYKI